MTTKRSSFHIRGDQISDVSENNEPYTPELGYRIRPNKNTTDNFNLLESKNFNLNLHPSVELNNRCDSSDTSRRNVHIREINNNCPSSDTSRGNIQIREVNNNCPSSDTSRGSIQIREVNNNCHNLDISNSLESGDLSIKVIGGKCDIYNANISPYISTNVKRVVVPNRGYQNLDMYSTDNGSVEFVQAEICKISSPKTDNNESNNCMFRSMIISLFDIKADKSNCTGLVEFIIKRKDKIITLQWEGFSGKIAGNGIKYVHVAQSIAHLPQYPISKPIVSQYNGDYITSRIEINPHSSPYDGIIKFYLYLNGNQENIRYGDSVHIPGSSITWIIE